MKVIRKWRENRYWKKEYGTDQPKWIAKWGKEDLSNINKIIIDPDFITWYSELKPDKKLKADRVFNNGINLVSEYYDKLIEGIDDELKKRGELIEPPDTTRD